MRIDAYNQINQIYQSTSKVNVSKANRTYGSDKVEISQFGKEFQIAKQAVAGANDVREDVVAAAKARLQAGEYDVSTDELAAKLAEKFSTNIF